MSIRVMSQVWANSKMKGSGLLLLLAISDHARDEGDGAWPSVETLRKKVHMSERHVHRLIALLEASGELTVQHGAGPGGANMYTVCPGGAKMSSPPHLGVTPASARGDARGTGGVTPASARGDARGTQTVPNRPPTIKNRADFRTTEEYDAYWRRMGAARLDA